MASPGVSTRASGRKSTRERIIAASDCRRPLTEEIFGGDRTRGLASPPIPRLMYDEESDVAHDDGGDRPGYGYARAYPERRSGPSGERGRDGAEGADPRNITSKSTHQKRSK